MSATDEELLKVAFEMIAEDGWRPFSMHKLAEKAGLTIGELYERAPSKYALLRLLAREADKKMLSVGRDELAEMAPRERLFELFMRRFDALAPYKSGLERFGRTRNLDCDLVMTAGCNLDRMARWMLEAASIELDGLQARLARRVLMGIYVRVFNIWLDDDSEDLAKTLAELDKRLGQAERFARFGCRGRRFGPATAAA